MELVYLWVEKYKNIKNQGFNFSPRFECEFFPVYEDKKLNYNSKLEINPKKNKSIFPENINITAIAGENGSGKSSIVQSFLDQKSEYIFFLIYIDSNDDKYFYIPCKEQVCSSIFNKLEMKEISFSDINFIYYTSNMLDDSINININSFQYISFKKNILEIIKNNKEKNINNSHSFNQLINTKITLEVLEFLKSDINFIPINFSPPYIEVLIKKESEIPIYLKEYTSKSTFPYVGGYLKFDIPFGKVNKNFIEKLKNNEVEFQIGFKYNKNTGNIFYIPSQGYIEYLFMLSQLYKKIENNKNSVVILDEPVNSYHPNWQKEFINNLKLFITKNFSTENKISIIITTHSPFILSDLPKENIIFLEQYKKEDIEVQKGNQKVGNCKNASSSVSIEQTFGANIHTLLSHGFFMSDGLMGEFAKKKIDKVIKILNSKKKLSKKKKKYCKNIISIVGEPVLKNTLENMFEEKLYKNESKLHRLKRKQKKLDKEIKVLKAKSNEKS